ncbi:uncharacterized protein LOC119373205 [Rhipicephalus sanguineus]|uniref:uncharacterized protein LOC119373205 n=1 Tax=Rhipicephalus sanguineus TaxID=34632 RepID=UPI0018930FD7|nr:uncharacterized protein LOC119373205 [Rhipicephalus sanguineus]
MNAVAFSNFLASFLALTFASYIGSVLSQHMEWHFGVKLYEDTHYDFQHWPTCKTKEEYYRELFHAVERRFSLLRHGRLVLIRHGYQTLTHTQSNALFGGEWKKCTINEIYKNWHSPHTASIRAQARDNEVIIVITKRTLTLANGNEATGIPF